MIDDHSDAGAKFLQLHLGGDRNFCYLIGDPQTGTAAAVDPGFDLAEDDGARLRRGTASGTAPDLNLDRAIAEFGAAVARARAASPPSSDGGAGNNVFSPDPANLPPTGFGVGNLVFESRDYDWTDYARQIYWAIWKAWHARMYHTVDEFERWGLKTKTIHLNHQARVRFVIEKDGDVTGIVIESDSGCPPMDASAADALNEVVLPGLPDDFPRDREVVHARFVAIGEIPAMRPSLRWLRAQGYF